MIDAAPTWTAQDYADGTGPAHLSVRDLACARGGRQLFSGLSFDAEPGSAIEIRGPNGVGKTTLLRAIAGLLRPTSGDITLRIGDHAAESAEMRGQSMHFVGPEPSARPEETIRDSLNHWAAMWGAGPRETQSAIDRLDLSRLSDRAVRRLSSGERKRLGLARLMLQARPIWLLDEPNTGLDAAGRSLCHRLITNHRGQGGIVIVATHDAANLAGALMIRLGVRPPTHSVQPPPLGGS